MKWRDDTTLSQSISDYLDDLKSSTVAIFYVDAVSFKNVAETISEILKQNQIHAYIDIFENSLSSNFIRKMQLFDKRIFIVPLGSFYVSNLTHVISMSTKKRNIIYYTVEGDTLYKNLLLKLNLQNISKYAKIIANSYYTYNIIRKHDVKITDVIYHSIPKSYINDAKKLKDWAYEFFKENYNVDLTDKFVYMTNANKNTRKGWDKYVKALTMFYKHCLKNKIEDTVHVLITDYNLKQHKFIKKLIEKKRIIQLDLGGSLSYKEILSLYNVSKVYVVSSKSEGFCMPIAESLYFNNCVICVKHQLFKELIREDVAYFFDYESIIQKPNEHGFMCEYYEYEASELAKTMLKAYKNQDLTEKKRKATKKYYDKFLAENNYPKFLLHLST